MDAEVPSPRRMHIASPSERPAPRPGASPPHYPWISSAAIGRLILESSSEPRGARETRAPHFLARLTLIAHFSYFCIDRNERRVMAEKIQAANDAGAVAQLSPAMTRFILH